MRQTDCVMAALRGWGRVIVAVAIFAPVLMGTSCRSPSRYRQNADKVAYESIDQMKRQALGRSEPFTIERPSDILRRRLIEEQELPVSGAASLGTDALPPVRHAPEDDYPAPGHSPDVNIPIEPNKPVKISLINALQIAARNSPDYQSQKERVFVAALSLDLTRHSFRPLVSGGTDHGVNVSTGDETVTSVSNSGSANAKYLLKNGVTVTSAVGITLLNLLTQGGGQALGLNVDASVSVPLLRGAGRHIVLEPLTQAERDVIYRLWEFDRYRRTFAVNIASDYYGVLRQMDSLQNSRDNYRSAIQSTRWSQQQGDAGRLPQIQVDQAVQRELTARSGWVSAQLTLDDALDSFKTLIGLPADARIEPDMNDLEALQDRGARYIELVKAMHKAKAADTTPSADADVILTLPDKEDAGPYEIDELVATRLALSHRLDLRTANGEVYDAQRQVVVAADALRTGLTLSGSASYGGRPGGGRDEDIDLNIHRARYSALLGLDLPIDRTRERNDYRVSLINLEQKTRTVQTLEDHIKTAVRSELRTLLQAREDLKISAQSVVIAEDSVANADLQLKAGRVLIRDLLEAQDALLAARNGLSSAVIQYRIAELELQRDLDMLEVTDKGFKELTPEEMKI